MQGLAAHAKKGARGRPGFPTRMSLYSVADVLDALMVAKKATALMPRLPPHVKMSHVRIIFFLKQIENPSKARITEINDVARNSTPNTTRLVNDLVRMRLATKSGVPHDRRVVLVELTAEGQKFYSDYIKSFHERLIRYFEGIGKQRCIQMGNAIKEVYRAIQKAADESHHQASSG